MKRMRSVESDSVKSARKAKDKLHKVCERASETRERTLYRQEQNRMHKASMRESETFEQTMHRQEQNRMRMASMRESAVLRVWHFSAFHSLGKLSQVHPAVASVSTGIGRVISPPCRIVTRFQCIEIKLPHS